jgi:hypothetical protein
VQPESDAADVSLCLKVDEDQAFFRPFGKISLERASAMIASAIRSAREQGIGKLLIDTSAWTGLPSPDTVERYYMVRNWAKVAAGRVRVAIVARPEMIDPEKFGVMVARNNGFSAEVFTSEQEALAWLNSRTPPP